MLTKTQTNRQCWFMYFIVIDLYLYTNILNIAVSFDTTVYSFEFAKSYFRPTVNLDIFAVD